MLSCLTEQNLSEWKQTGHQEWLRQEETRSLVAKLTEQAEDLGEASDGQEISDRLASVLAAELAGLAEKLLEEVTDPAKRWRRLREVLRELRHLQHEDHNGQRNQLQRECWERELEREAEEAEKRMEQEEKKRLRGILFSVLTKRHTADLFGGGEQGERMAEMLHRIKFDLPLDDLPDPKQSGKTQSDGIKPGQTESSPIRPNPT